MCFGGKTKETKAPPPTPPTTFDYDAGTRGTSAQQTQAAIQSSTATSQASFGSELAGMSPVVSETRS